jgi:REP element-mobilizing transposase RayT
MNQLRKLHRLSGYDYGHYGYYFVTVCTLGRAPILCRIVGNDALVVPYDIGKKVNDCWNNIEIMNENIKVDKFVLMPNHVHGIIIIKSQDSIEDYDKKYGFEIRERRGRRSLQGLMKDFKSVTTRYYKKFSTTSDISLWQKSYYDEIIRTDEQYLNIWRYIDENPLKWQDDQYYI